MVPLLMHVPGEIAHTGRQGPVGPVLALLVGLLNSCHLKEMKYMVISALKHRVETVFLSSINLIIMETN